MQGFAAALALLSIFAVILVLLRYSVNLGVSILAGTALLFIVFYIPPQDMAESLYASLTGWMTVRLLLLVFLVVFMSRLMSITGNLDDMVLSLKGIFTDRRWSMATISALIGLLPMPAGALVSGHMIDSTADELKLSPEERTAVNYWFRHVWEYSWPFYQGVILSAATLAVSVAYIVSIQFPVTLLSITIGIFFFLLPMKKHPADIRSGKRDLSALMRFTVSIWPIILSIALSIGLGIDLLWSLLLTVALMALIYRPEPAAVKDVMRKSGIGKILFILLAVMLFKGALIDTGAVYALPTALDAMKVSPIVLVVAIPFIVGFMSGITVAFVGISYPILLPVLRTANGIDPGLTMLAFTAGFAGTLLSPMHLCLVLSAEYFKAELPRVFRRLYLPVGLILAGAFIFYLLMDWVAL